MRASHQDLAASRGPRARVGASPGNVIDMLNVGPHFRPAKSGLQQETSVMSMCNKVWKPLVHNLVTQSVVPGAYWNCRLLGSITDLLDNLSLYLNISQVMYRYSKGQETPVYKSPGRSLKPQLKGRDERAVHSQQHTWHKQTQVQD